MGGEWIDSVYTYTVHVLRATQVYDPDKAYGAYVSPIPLQSYGSVLITQQRIA